MISEEDRNVSIMQILYLIFLSCLIYSSVSGIDIYFVIYSLFSLF
jgi:hypothetical protein